MLSYEKLRAMADASGFAASPRNAVRLAPGSGVPRAKDVVAWRLGADAARALRAQEALGAKPIANLRLTELAGVERRALEERSPVPGISFALDNGATKSKVVLKPKSETGRRFALARILGDRLVASGAGKLFPATRAYTYRQKMQRSFAAEFLSPFEAIDDMMEGDYSLENQQDTAEHFNVSPLTIRTLLVNHQRIEREQLDEEPDLVAA